MAEQRASIIEYIDPNILKAHAFNEKVYGDDGFEDLIQSIADMGVLQAIYTKKDNTVISGHRRWRAAVKSGVKLVPVIRISYPSDLDEKQAIIEHNRYRIKNGLQLYNEGAELEVIYEAKARARQLSNLKQGDTAPVVENLPPREPDERKTRDRVARAIGLGSGRQWDKLNFVADHKPELLPNIRPGKRSLSSAFNEVRRLEKAGDIGRHDRTELVGMYNVFYADPPWAYDNNSTFIRSVSDNEYPTLSLEDICSIDVQSHTLSEAVLFLWTTTAMIEKALRVIPAWGFTFKTSMVWVKNRIGTGFYVRSKHEYILIATRGSFLPMTTKIPESVFFADVGEHSEKPDIVYDLIERMYPGQRYCELFARKRHSDKWYVWGNEIDICTATKDYS
ncbi:ParB N-terminal domain-containing protein [Patescibacteria group bacterium]|nr:ParB N-terminal domain-containing protein [Patescibacteria group bacterium]